MKPQKSGQYQSHRFNLNVQSEYFQQLKEIEEIQQIRSALERLSSRERQQTRKKKSLPHKNVDLQPLPTSKFDRIQSSITQRGQIVDTIFGDRIFLNADFTAYGLSLDFIENMLTNGKIDQVRNIWNDQSSLDCKSKSLIFHIINNIKEFFGADIKDILTFAYQNIQQPLKTFQNIMGLSLNFATEHIILELWSKKFENQNYFLKNFFISNLLKNAQNKIPLVILGPDEPYQVHMSWSDCLCDVLYMVKDKTGDIDINHLKNILSAEDSNNRLVLSFFSLCSPINGVIYSYENVVTLLKQYHAITCLNVSMGVSYLKVNMNFSKDPNIRIDAIIASFDQIIGGANSPSILLFNPSIYNRKLPPLHINHHNTAYADPEIALYYMSSQIRELDEKPQIKSLIRAYYSIQTHNLISFETFLSKSKHQVDMLNNWFVDEDNILILNPVQNKNKLPITSFLLFYKEQILHPGFVSELIYDLFGIKIGYELTDSVQNISIPPLIEGNLKNIMPLGQKGYFSILPCWNKIALHAFIDEDEIEFIVNAIRFVANFGVSFIDEYALNLFTGKWKNVKRKSYFSFNTLPGLNSIINKEAFNVNTITKIHPDDYKKKQKEFFNEHLQRALTTGKYLMEKMKSNNLEEKLRTTKTGIDEYDKVKYFLLTRIINKKLNN